MKRRLSKEPQKDQHLRSEKWEKQKKEPKERSEKSDSGDDFLNVKTGVFRESNTAERSIKIWKQPLN